MKYFFATLLLCSVNLFGQTYNETDFRNYIEKNKDSLSPIEGLWKIQVTREYYHFDTLVDVKKEPDELRIAVVKNGMVFNTYTPEGKTFDLEFNPTDVKGVFLYRNYFPEISEYSKVQAVICKRGEMEYTFDYPLEYLKAIYKDKYNENTRVVNILKWTRILPEPGK